jgi:hypothetical protein
MRAPFPTLKATCVLFLVAAAGEAEVLWKVSTGG